MEVKLPNFECLRCGHKWHPRNEEMPMCCGFCKSPYWNKQSTKKSLAAQRHQDECISCKQPLTDQ